jgi:hypothetical protein
MSEHAAHADQLLETLKRYPHCENDQDRADMQADKVLLAQALATAELAGREAAGQGAWVDCRERMPEEGAWVLGWSVADIDGHGMMLMLHMVRSGFGPGERWIRHDGNVIRHETVTHWMPLPPPPSKPPERAK